MINIWYENVYPSGTVRGPVKVIDNLKKSLDDCGIEYADNEEKYKHNFMLHWDVSKYLELKNKKSLLIGPQVWPWSSDFNQIGEYSKIIVPSKWVQSLYELYFPESKTLVWPVSIYKPNFIATKSEVECLVYYKNRPKEHLDSVLDILNKKNISYVGLEYGNYNQKDFKEVLSEVKYCIIIDNTESQGIAIQEMMASNKPLFVWDQIIWDHMGEDYQCSATSVPYWSNECGEIVKDILEFEEKFENFRSNLENYFPQKYVMENLSPKTSVKILLNHFSTYGDY